MAKLRLLTNNYIDDAYLTCTLSENNYDSVLRQDIPTFPVSNLKSLSKARVLRTIDNEPTAINCILETELPINCIILNGHNLTYNTTLSIELYTDPFFTDLETTIPYTVGSQECSCINTLTQTNLVIWTQEYYNIRSIRIHIENSGANPILDYFEISKLFIGNYLEALIGVSKGYDISWEDDTVQYRTEKGSLASTYVASRKAFNFSLDTIQERERVEIQRALVGVGLQKDFFISLFPEISDTVKTIDFRGVVKLTKIPIYKEYANNIYSAKFSMEEI